MPYEILNARVDSPGFARVLALVEINGVMRDTMSRSSLAVAVSNKGGDGVEGREQGEGQ